MQYIAFSSVYPPSAVCAHTLSHTLVLSLSFSHVCACAHACIHTHPHTRSHTHTHTITPTLTLSVAHALSSFLSLALSFSLSHTHTHTHTHQLKQWVPERALMYACMLHACVCMRVHLCIWMCVYVCVSVRACSCACVRVHVCVCVHVRVYMHVRQAENQRLAKEVATLQHLHHPSQQQSNRSALSCLSHTYLSIHICVHTMFQGAYMCIYIVCVYIPASEQ